MHYSKGLINTDHFKILSTYFIIEEYLPRIERENSYRIRIKVRWCRDSILRKKFWKFIPHMHAYSCANLRTPAHNCAHPYTPAHTHRTPMHTRTQPSTPAHTCAHPRTPAHTRAHLRTPAHTYDHWHTFVLFESFVPFANKLKAKLKK